MGKLFLKGTIHVKGLSAAECMNILGQKVKLLPPLRRRWWIWGGGYGGRILGSDRLKMEYWDPETSSKGIFSDGSFVRYRPNSDFQLLQLEVVDVQDGCDIRYKTRIRTHVRVFSFIVLSFFPLLFTLMIVSELFRKPSANGRDEVALFGFVAVSILLLLGFGTLAALSLRSGKEAAVLARDKLKEWLGEYDIEDIEQ